MKDQQLHAGAVLTLPTESMDRISAHVSTNTMTQEYLLALLVTTAV